MVSTKNILLIGRTGSGKSALANVLVNKEENFENGGIFKEEFKEGEYSISETRDIQVGEFDNEEDNEEVKYRIIDTIGIGNAKLTEEEIICKITKACYKFKDGLTQVLFVIGGKFTQEEIKIYNIIKKRVFDDDDIAKYTTIVRTNFHNFQDPEKCNEDIRKLREENNKNNSKIVKMVNSCNSVIHVDNLPMSSASEEEIFSRKRKRKVSKSIVLTHLAGCKDFYKIRNLELINDIFEKNVSGDGQLDKELADYFKRKKKD